MQKFQYWSNQIIIAMLVNSPSISSIFNILSQTIDFLFKAALDQRLMPLKVPVNEIQQIKPLIFQRHPLNKYDYSEYTATQPWQPKAADSATLFIVIELRIQHALDPLHYLQSKSWPCRVGADMLFEIFCCVDYRTC